MRLTRNAQPGATVLPQCPVYRDIVSHGLDEFARYVAERVVAQDLHGAVVGFERVACSRALDRSLTRLRRIHRARARCRPGLLRYRRRTSAISALNARLANQRSDAIHRLTTRLAKTHGTVVVESLNVSGSPSRDSSRTLQPRERCPNRRLRPLTTFLATAYLSESGLSFGLLLARLASLSDTGKLSNFNIN